MEPRTPAEWKTLFESEAFARQTEYYGPLGVEYTPAGTHLRLWAPTAKQAAVNLYRRGTGGACVGTLPLQQQDKGVWSIYLPATSTGNITISPLPPVWHLQCSGPLRPLGRGERGAQHDL